MRKSTVLLGLFITGFFGGCADLHEANRCYAMAKAICKSHCVKPEDKCIEELQSQCQKSSVERSDLDKCIKGYRKDAGDDFGKCIDDAPEACEGSSSIEGLLDFGEDFESSSSGFGGSGGSRENPYSSNGSGGSDPYGGTGGSGGSDPYGGTGGSGGSDPYGGTGGSGGSDPYGGTGGSGGSNPYGGTGGSGGSGGSNGSGGGGGGRFAEEGTNEPYYTSGLVVQWDFDASSGSVLYPSYGYCGSICDGQLVNFTDTSGRDRDAYSGWITQGSLDGALRFDGDDDHVQLYVANMFAYWDELTIEARVRPRGEMGRLISSGLPFNQEIVGFGMSNYYVDFFLTESSAGSPSVSISDDYYFDERFHYVAITWSAYDYTRLYVDGDLRREDYNYVDVVYGGDTLATIGAQRSFDVLQSFDGDIDLLRIYDQALSYEAIYQSYERMMYY